MAIKFKVDTEGLPFVSARDRLMRPLARGSSVISSGSPPPHGSGYLRARPPNKDRVHAGQSDGAIFDAGILR
jgi:hypothetical protein